MNTNITTITAAEVIEAVASKEHWTLKLKVCKVFLEDLGYTNVGNKFAEVKEKAIEMATFLTNNPITENAEVECYLYTENVVAIEAAETAVKAATNDLETVRFAVNRINKVKDLVIKRRLWIELIQRFSPNILRIVETKSVNKFANYCWFARPASGNFKVNAARKRVLFQGGTNILNVSFYYGRSNVNKEVEGLLNKEVDRGFVAKTSVYSDNEFTRCGFCQPENLPVVLSTEGGSFAEKVPQNFSSEIAVLNFKYANVSAKSTDKIKNIIQYVLNYNNIIYLAGIRTNGAFSAYWFVNIGNNRYIDLLRMEEVSYSAVRQQLSVVVNEFKYIPFITSPSGERSMSVQLLRIRNGEDPNAKLEHIIDKVTCGTYRVLKAAYGGKELPVGKVAKLLSRLSLFNTGTTPLGNVKKYALINGELGKYTDGQGIISASFAKECYKEKGFDLPAQHYVGTGMQTRGPAMKGYNLVVYKDYIREHLQHLEKEGWKFKYLPNPTFDDSVAIETYSEDFDNKTIVMIGIEEPTTEEEKIDTFRSVSMVVDRSCVKAVHDLSQGTPLSVIDTTADAKEHSSLSIQVAIGLMSHKDFEKEVFEIGKNHVDEILQGTPCISFSTVKDVKYVDNTVGALNKAYALADPVIAKSLIDQKAKEIQKDLNRLHFKVDGQYLKIIRDLGCDFGTPLLKANECIIGGNVAEEVEGNCVRYPHNNGGEYVPVRNVGGTIFDTIDEMVAKGIYTVSAGHCLKEIIRNLKPGQIILATSDPRIFNCLGGADVDGDAVVFFSDKIVLKLFKAVKTQAIDFGDSISTAEKAKLCLSLRTQFYHDSIANANDPIGIITNRNMGHISLASVIVDMSDEAFNEIAEFVKEQRGCEKYFKANKANIYKRRFVEDNVLVDEEVVNKWYKEVVKQYNLGVKENMVNILLDLSVINASVANRSIDAGKNKQAVFAPFKEFGSIIEAGAIQDVKLNVDNDQGNNDIIVTFAEIPTGFTSRFNKQVYVANDKIVAVKNKLAEYATKKLAKLANESNTMAALNQFKQVETDKEYMRVAYYYANLNSGMLTSGSENYGKVKEYIANSCRIMAIKHGVNNLLDHVKSASRVKNGGYTRFHLAFGPEVIMDCLGKKAPVFFEPVYAWNEQTIDNAVIKLTNGCNDTLFTKTKLDGEYAITKERGRIGINIDYKQYVKDSLDINNKIALSIQPIVNNQGKVAGGNVSAHFIQLAGIKDYKFVIRSQERDILFAINPETGKETPVGKLVSPKGRNPIADFMNGKVFTINYVERYNPANNKKEEYTAVFGELVDSIQ